MAVETAAPATAQRDVDARMTLDRLETAEVLDSVANPLSDAIKRVLPQRLSDFLHGVWFGHPLNPVLVQVPVGTWLSASVLDIVPGTEQGATALVGVGTAAALPAAAAGWTDWASLAPEQRRVGLVHAGTNAVAIGLQAASFLARRAGRHSTGRRLSLTALAVASAGAYLGGHLSYRQAAGVNHAAPLLRNIPEGWRRVASVADVPAGSPTVRTVGDAGIPVLLVRDDDAVTAMIERCAHQSGPLGEGSIEQVAGAACIVCPWHGSAYRLADGAVLRGPAATDQPTLRVRIVDDQIEVALP